MTPRYLILWGQDRRSGARIGLDEDRPFADLLARGYDRVRSRLYRAVWIEADDARHGDDGLTDEERALCLAAGLTGWCGRCDGVGRALAPVVPQLARLDAHAEVDLVWTANKGLLALGIRDLVIELNPRDSRRRREAIKAVAVATSVLEAVRADASWLVLCDGTRRVLQEIELRARRAA